MNTNVKTEKLWRVLYRQVEMRQGDSFPGRKAVNNEL